MKLNPPKILWEPAVIDSPSGLAAPAFPECPRVSPVPGVNDLSPLPAVLVIVQDDVAVPAIELPVRGGVHRHLLGAFDSPDLGERSRAAGLQGCSTSASPAALSPNPSPELPRPLPGSKGQFPSVPAAAPSAARSLFGAFLNSQTSAGTAVGFWTALSPFRTNSPLLLCSKS